MSKHMNKNKNHWPLWLEKAHYVVKNECKTSPSTPAVRVMGWDSRLMNSGKKCNRREDAILEEDEDEWRDGEWREKWRNVLENGSRLRCSDELVSWGGNYVAKVVEGVLCVYVSRHLVDVNCIWKSASPVRIKCSETGVCCLEWCKNTGSLQIVKEETNEIVQCVWTPDRDLKNKHQLKLMLHTDGNLLIIDENKKSHWSSNSVRL